MSVVIHDYVIQNLDIYIGLYSLNNIAYMTGAVVIEQVSWSGSLFNG